MMIKENIELRMDFEVSDSLPNGLAAVMNSILITRKPKRKKTIILSKAKKFSQMKVKFEDNCNEEEVLQSKQIKVS